MNAVTRKQCATCGEPSLESEPRCWACGEILFVPPGTPMAGERTVAVPARGEQTVSWVPVARSNHPTLLYAALTAGLTAFACGAGFLLGRSDSPRERRPVAPPRAHASILPAPPPLVRTPPTAVPVFQPQPVYDPPVVAIRPGPRPEPVTQPRSAPPQPIIFRTAPPPAARAPRPRSEGGIIPAAPAPVRAPVIGLRPTASTGILSLHNENLDNVEVTIEGNGVRTAFITTGTTVPLPLPPGIYHLRAKGGGAAPAESTLQIEAQRSYAVVVTRERGSDSLMLLEPAGGG